MIRFPFFVFIISTFSMIAIVAFMTLIIPMSRSSPSWSFPLRVGPTFLVLCIPKNFSLHLNFVDYVVETLDSSHSSEEC